MLGTGCAWAGHKRPSMPPALLLMRSPSVFTVNFGKELPTGSGEERISFGGSPNPATTYLKAGTGDP